MADNIVGLASLGIGYAVAKNLISPKKSRRTNQYYCLHCAKWHKRNTLRGRQHLKYKAV